ncbi:hypothetical protein [Clostridium sp. ZBS2]|uniref:hypothetical protein n=1 Tax=Clostridium sp. ZBS2 TaxID=2949976 RepID=UPI00207ADC95|nr:hypothetical protein [Clostridium sp. ZBS2]
MIYDGSTLESIEKSLANIFNIEKEALIEKIIDYYFNNIDEFDKNEYLYEDFIESIGVDDTKVVFDYINLFHVISSIDNLDTIKKFGLLDLKESLIRETSLKKYLSKIGINFILTDSVNLTYKDLKYDLSKYNKDNTSTNTEYWKAYYAEYLFHRLSFDYNINGFLFLDNACIDDSYLDLKNESEFFNRLKMFIGDNNLFDEWLENSCSYILKCTVKTGQATLGNGLKWEEEAIEAKKLTKQLIDVSIRIIVDMEVRGEVRYPSEYVLVKNNVIIPFTDIEILDYK